MLDGVKKAFRGAQEPLGKVDESSLDSEVEMPSPKSPEPSPNPNAAVMPERVCLSQGRFGSRGSCFQKCW